MKLAILLVHLIFLNLSLGQESDSIYLLNQTWRNQQNEPFELKKIAGYTTVVTMIFTSCPGACPMMVSRMMNFDSKLSKDEKKMVRYLLFSIDPKRDTPKVLLDFQKKMKLDNRWTLLTSDERQIRELSVALGFNYKQMESGDFTHSTTIYLLSATGKILATQVEGTNWSEFLSKLKNK